jgi:hypothetical protein
MLVVRTFEVALDRAESVGDAMRRARAALAAVGAADAPVRLYLSDTRTGAVRSCARVLRGFPELAALACTVEGGDVVSSFDEGVSGSVAHLGSAMTHERVQALADRVPRSLRLNDSDFFFGPVPALLGAASSRSAPPVRQSGRPHTDSVAGELAILSHWWITGRRTGLFAAASEDLPPRGADGLPPIAEPVAALLDALDAPWTERRRLEPTSTAEQSAIDDATLRAEARLADLRVIWAAERARLSFPHALDPDPVAGELLPLRAALAEILAPLGYRMRTGRRPQPAGMWILRKRTARSNELELRLDRGPINGRLSARLVLVGPLWRHDLGALPLSAERTELAVGSDGAARRALLNLCVSASAAEARLVPPLEESHGDGMAWLVG